MCVCVVFFFSSGIYGWGLFLTDGSEVVSTVCPPLPPVSVSKMLQGPLRSLLTHLYSGTKSCSKLQRSFWLVMNGPLSDVSTHHAVISWLSHKVLWLTLWHIHTVEWRAVTLIGTGKSACWSFFSVYVMVGVCSSPGVLAPNTALFDNVISTLRRL